MADAVPLRVLVVGVRWPPETFIARLVRGLLDAGVAVTVASAQRPDASWRSHPGFSWLRAPAWDGLAARRLADLVRLGSGAALRAPIALPALMAEAGRARGSRLRGLHRRLPYLGRDWDVVYFPWNAAAIAHPDLFGREMAVVISCRGAQVNVAPHNPERTAIRDGLRWTFERATAVHCVSAHIRDAAQTLGLPTEKAHVIRPAVDARVFSPPDTPPVNDAFEIVTTGSLIWRKGLEYGLAALRRLLDDGVRARLHIIGDGPERQRVLYTILDLGLHEHAVLHGRLPPDAVRERLRTADAFVLPSLSEGISNAVLEAMACGLPVVTTDCGGMREAVTDGVEGFVVPARDDAAMARALARLATDRELRHRMGAAGRRRVLAAFTLEDQVAAFVALLASAAVRRETVTSDAARSGPAHRTLPMTPAGPR